ncbi:MAG: enoyl-CoA hydratase-related protein [Vampirovibrionales bacterium]|nr:enoyl-CoA hydratase-related protein [Vampirovibrionales bacterium]
MPAATLTLHDRPLVEAEPAKGLARWITLQRPDVHNAFNEVVIKELTQAIMDAGAENSVKALVLAAEGPSFSAGADLAWMAKMTTYSQAENEADARGLYSLLNTLRHSAKPTLARVQGNAFGGGVGLIAACDMAVALESCRFGLTEVKLGLIPAVISPVVIEAIGPRQARWLFQTGELFDAPAALRMGLCHAVVSDETALDGWITKRLGYIAANGPVAMHDAKELVFAVNHSQPSDYERLTTQWIARRRASAEGKEGTAAFLEKRSPVWPTE